MSRNKFDVILDEYDFKNLDIKPKEIRKLDEREFINNKRGKEQITVTISKEVMEYVRSLQTKYSVKSLSETMEIILKSALGL